MTLLVALTIAACSSVAQQPGPQASTPTPSTRPKTVSMTGIDPCATLTDDQIRQLGIRSASRSDNPPEPTTGNVGTCIWQSNTGGKPHTGLYVQGVTYRGFDDIRADTTHPEAEFDLRGFRAVTRDNSLNDEALSCQVFVDVADGQTFQVAYIVDADSTRAQACERAKQAADYGMTYLLNR